VKTLSATLWRTATVLTAAAVLMLALSPAPPPTLSTGWDKANHLLAFATLGGLASQGWRSAWTWACLLAFGGAIELLQALTPTREASWADLGADALGLALAALVVGAIRRRARA
jgi:VanZ family protein